MLARFLSEYLNESRSLIDQAPENRLSLIVEKIKDELELRAVSCIQIANKLSTKSIVNGLLIRLLLFYIVNRLFIKVYKV